MSDNAVAVVETKPHELSVTEVKAQVAKIQALMTDLMQEGIHYGKSFPGDTKKNLLKPGADKLCFMFRLRPDFTQETRKLPGGHMEVKTQCQIYHIESGQKIAEGIGLATTMESKYRWRNAARKCPSCGKETIILGKDEYGGGWVCHRKKGGCGAKFKEDDPSIINQVVGKVENPDIADVYNTVIKMSKKRAYVDATITACAASDIFTQDAEDFKTDADTLANEAARNEPRDVTEPPQSKPQSPKPPKPKSPPDQQTKPDERMTILNAISEILKTANPDDNWRYFTKAEIDQEHAIALGAENNQALRSQQDRLRKTLIKRQAKSDPAAKKDDIHWGGDGAAAAAGTPGELDIY